MKAVVWTDPHGRTRRSIIRDTDGPEMAAQGIPAEPPDIYSGIDWNLIKAEISKKLIDAGLYTWDDVMKTPGGVTPALNVLKRHLHILYKLQAGDAKPGG